MKKVVAAGAAIVFAVLLLTGCGGDLPSNAMAKVGQTTITKEQLDAKMQEVVSQLGTQAPDKSKDPAAYKTLEQQVLDYMVTLEIAKQKAPELKVAVSDADIQAQIDQVKTTYFGGDETKFQDALKQQKITLEQLKQSYTERLLLGKLSEAATAGVTVSDAELQKYYDEHKAEFNQGETRQVRHILIAPEGTPDANGKYTDAQWQAALAKAEKVRAEVVADPASFAAKAKEVSADPGSKDQGGELGDVQKGTMVPEFDQAVFSQKVDEISEPIKTQYGYHIIQVEGITPAKLLTLAEVKEKIKSTLLDQKRTKAWDEWLTKVRKDLKVIIAEGMAYVTTTTAVTSAPAGATDTTAGATDTTAGAATTTTK